jgi:hypothetical protein
VSVRLAPKPIPVALAVAPNSVWVLTTKEPSPASS